MEPMTCAVLRQLLPDYLDGGLPAAESAAIEEHLSACEACRLQVATLRKAVGLCQHLPPPDFPPAARERLYKVLHIPPNE